MEKTYTSASANKRLKSIRESQAYLLEQELENCTYILSQGEDEDPPAYDYASTRTAIEALDAEALAIRHALHVFNAHTKLPDSDMTIDEGLVRIAQLSDYKKRLAKLRSNQQKQRVSDRFGSSSQTPEYKYANYDVRQAEEDYRRISEEISDLQLKIDLANQTLTFEASA